MPGNRYGQPKKHRHQLRGFQDPRLRASAAAFVPELDMPIPRIGETRASTENHLGASALSTKERLEVPLRLALGLE